MDRICRDGQKITINTSLARDSRNQIVAQSGPWTPISASTAGTDDLDRVIRRSVDDSRGIQEFVLPVMTVSGVNVHSEVLRLVSCGARAFQQRRCLDVEADIEVR